MPSRPTCVRWYLEEQENISFRTSPSTRTISHRMHVCEEEKVFSFDVGLEQNRQFPAKIIDFDVRGSTLHQTFLRQVPKSHSPVRNGCFKSAEHIHSFDAESGEREDLQIRFPGRERSEVQHGSKIFSQSFLDFRTSKPTVNELK